MAGKRRKPMGRPRAGLTRPQLRKLDRATVELQDGKLENAMSGLGRPGVDQATATRWRRIGRMTVAEAREEYANSWAARTEIDRPAQDLVREKFTFENLPPEVDQTEVWAYLDDLGSDLVGIDMPEDRGLLAALSRLHGESHKGGGAALLMVIDDGLPPWMPVDLTRVRSLSSLELLERDEISPVRASIDGRVSTEHYLIGSVRSSMSPGQLVHVSRLVLSKGARLSPSEEYLTGWGASVLAATEAERMSMHTAMHEVGSVVLNTGVDVALFAELNEALCSEDSEERAAIDERIGLIAKHRGQHRVIPLDAGRSGIEGRPGRPSDSYQSIARPVDGLRGLLETSENHWAGATGQTPGLALGKTTGWNTGENASDWQSWGGRIAGLQKTWLAPRLDQILTVVFSAQDGPTGGVIPETWGYKFAPLWRPSESEEEATRKARTETDLLMQAAGWITSEQAAEQRLVHGATGELSLSKINETPVELEAIADAGSTVDTALGQLLFETIGKLRAGEIDVDLALTVITAAAPGVDAWTLREQLAAAFPPPAPTSEAEQDAEPELDPVEVALADIPKDLASSKDIGEMLTVEFGRLVTPHKITALARQGRLRGYQHLSGQAYSRAAARRLLAEQMGLIEPEPEDDPTPPGLPQEPEQPVEPEPEASPADLASDELSDTIEQRGETWVILSEAGDLLAEFTGPDAEDQARERLRQIEAAKAAKAGES